MQIIPSAQIEHHLGKFGIFSGKAGNTIVSAAKYLGGIPDFDKRNSPGGMSPVSFEMRPNGIELFVFEGFGRISIALFFDKINYWAFEPQKEIIEKKSKSIIGRALIGGLLLGPVGAIVGGMTGIGKKESAKSVTGVDNILSISYTDNSREHIILFDCSNQKAKSVFDFFNKNLPGKYVTEPAEPKTNTSGSVADELIKLKNLLDLEVITQDEFDQQKRKLL